MSKMKLISEKLESLGVASEDLSTITDTISEMVAESVDTLVEEEKTKIEAIAEEYCAQKIEEGVKAVKEELIEEYDSLLEAFETELVEKLDTFLEMEISSKISEDTLKSIAVNETYKPIIEGIKGLFESEYVALDVEGHGLVRRKQSEVEQLEEQLSQALAEKMELQEAAELAATKLLIANKTKDLTESEIVRVQQFFEGKSFDEVNKKIDGFVDIVTESVTAAKKTSTLSESKKSQSIVESASSDDCLDDKKVDLTKKDEELQVKNITESIMDLASGLV